MTKLSKEELQKSSIDALREIAIEADGQWEAVWKTTTQKLYPDATPQEVENISSKLSKEALRLLDSLRYQMPVKNKGKQAIGAISTHRGVRYAK